eukprot:CAMPEP_0194278660 /NCGR_PEP_ID=MMETSP0169-20130528/11773_1 /TAXON_ID=218684 /ORGANISM="Corethron pennatum, Strain L29A3" /LENGTH=424 /DNA_ID=CAMNT_0039022895 /DNA_START=82 /DNA_END=1356 /DNA_ORIENTATION=+
MAYNIVSVANNGGAPEQSYKNLQAAGACDTKPFSEMFKFEVPSLMVGTLDSLMNLSDELGRTDAIVESVVRKIEKTHQELSLLTKRTDTALTVGGVPPTRYIQQFAWDYAKYPNRRPLKELVQLISGGVAAVDEELKQLGTGYAEKVASLSDAMRRKNGNLLVTDLNNVLKPQDMSKVTVHDTDYLVTVFVAVPKVLQDNFVKEVKAGNLGGEIAGYGGPDWSRNGSDLGRAINYGKDVDRKAKSGSPIVPDTLRLVKEDDDSVLYAVTILKGQIEPGTVEGGQFVAGSSVDFVEEFVKCCKEKRFVVRDFKYDPTQASKSAMQMEQMQVEVEGMKTGLTRWCRTHYGEAFVAWMHIKVIRVFVESVLRYGLPVDFTAVLYKAARNKESDLIASLDNAFGKNDDTGDDEDKEDYHEFVLLTFDP